MIAKMSWRISINDQVTPEGFNIDAPSIVNHVASLSVTNNCYFKSKI
jgi:hypothetical protein